MEIETFYIDRIHGLLPRWELPCIEKQKLLAILAMKMVLFDTNFKIMIKFGALPENINHFLPDVREYLHKHPKVLFAYLFGGLARGRVSPLSDVDIAIYLADGADIAQEKLETLGKLNELLKTDEVDLVILNTAPLPLAARIIKNKIILVDKMPFMRHKFESLVIRKYFDFSRKEMDIFKGRYKLGR